MSEVTKFEVGKEYKVRSVGDHDCIFSFTVTGRSNKFIMINGEGRTRRVGITIYDGAETALPLGKFSMAPIIRAA